MPDVKDFYEGLQEAFAWYCENKEEVERREYIEYIENEVKRDEASQTLRSRL